jgi:2-hydroxychromene-2-carboxylate isomerase
LTVVDFYLGLGSRYSYLAASQVDRLEAQYGCRFAWRPIASGALIDRRSDNPFRHQDGVGQYDGAYREYDAKAWAAHYGIPFREPAPFKVGASVPALACLVAERQGALVACCQALFALIFAEGAAIDATVIDTLPARLGLDAAAFRHDIDLPETRARHQALIEEAEARGAFGVPTFFLDGRMFWGNDRLPLLEAALRGVALPPWPHRTNPRA